MSLKLKCGFLTAPLLLALVLAAPMACTVWADTLELKNGSLIKGKFLGGTDTQISFQVGSTVQKYNVVDVVSLKFDPDGVATAPPISGSESPRPENQLPDNPAPNPVSEAPAETRPGYITIPAGTRITIRTIDSIDSTTNLVGDRFQASLYEPLTLNGIIIVPKDAYVEGRLTQAQESGTFAGRSQLRLELTGIIVNGKTVPIVTGEYEAIGKSRAASTARRTAGGAALGAIIGAAAGGGEGAAIGAGIGATAGATSEIILGGGQVKVPSETLLDFALQQDMSIPAPQS